MSSKVKPKIIREGEKFKSEHMLNLDGKDIPLTVKCAVDYLRLRYKVSPVITLIHGWSKEVQEAVSASIAECVSTCNNMLDDYREANGLGRQGELFDGEPGEA